jgi:hypothetical protein
MPKISRLTLGRPLHAPLNAAFDTRTRRLVLNTFQITDKSAQDELCNRMAHAHDHGFENEKTKFTDDPGKRTKVTPVPLQDYLAAALGAPPPIRRAPAADGPTLGPLLGALAARPSAPPPIRPAPAAIGPLAGAAV